MTSVLGEKKTKKKKSPNGSVEIRRQNASRRGYAPAARSAQRVPRCCFTRDFIAKTRSRRNFFAYFLRHAFASYTNRSTAPHENVPVLISRAFVRRPVFSARQRFTAARDRRRPALGVSAPGLPISVFRFSSFFERPRKMTFRRTGP